MTAATPLDPDRPLTARDLTGLLQAVLAGLKPRQGRASTEPPPNTPGRADVPDTDGDTFRAMIGRGNCRTWRRPALGMTYRLNHARRHLVLVEGDLLDDRVWAALDEDRATYAEVGWELRVLPAHLRGKVADEAARPAAQPDWQEAAPSGFDPHADADRRAADGFVRWARQNPEAADRAMAANPFPPPAGGDPLAVGWSHDTNYLHDITHREHVRVQHGPHGIIYLLDHPNKRFVLVGGDQNDGRVAALIDADRERFAAVGWLLHLPPGAPATAAERAEYRRLVADCRYGEALRKAATPAADQADTGGNALLELELIGGVLGLACRMCRDFADRHPGDTDPCRTPGRGDGTADPNGTDQFRRWVRTVTVAGAECGWASADLHAELPSAVVFPDDTPPAVALEHLARLAASSDPEGA